MVANYSTHLTGASLERQQQVRNNPDTAQKSSRGRFDAQCCCSVADPERLAVANFLCQQGYLFDRVFCEPLFQFGICRLVGDCKAWLPVSRDGVPQKVALVNLQQAANFVDSRI